MNAMFQKRDILIFVIICFLLGILLVRQFYVSVETVKIKKGEEEQLLALETSRLIKANADLRLEIQDLAATAEKYQKSLEDRQGAAEEMKKTLEKYKIIAGVTKVEGEGIEIKIDGDVSREQMVDLINALKNIGVEAISVNSKRLTISSYFESNEEGLFLNGQKLNKPYIISVIGNAPLIKEAVERKGGIIEQIQEGAKGLKIDVESKEKIILEPA